MASGKIIANGVTAFQDVTQEGVHVAAAGTFDSGSIAVEQDVNGTTVPVLDEGVAIVITADIDFLLNVTKGDRIRLNMTGVVTASDIDFNLAGASIAR